jgi:hypothetical protein
MINKNNRIYKYFTIFAGTLASILTVITLVSLLSIILTIIELELYNYSFCFTNTCLESTGKMFQATFALTTKSVVLLTSLATIGGIVFAIFSYLNVAQTNALNNHISHFKIFQDYVQAEIEKRSLLSAKHIDIFAWYNLIFEDSRSGSIDISNTYLLTIKGINESIDKSNEESSKALKGSFRYKNHQDRMILSFSYIGIQLTRHPRNNFFEIEGDILELISITNKAFTARLGVEKFPIRNYR